MRTIVIAFACEKGKVAPQATASNLLLFPVDVMFTSFAAPDIRAL